MSKEIIILAPISGKIINVKKVDDPVFSQEMVGKGFAIQPDFLENKIVSPIKGKIKMAFEGGHAYGILHKDVEILIHIGLETVSLKGKGFKQLQSSGTKVKINTPLSEIDFDYIKENAKSTEIIVLVTNETIGNYKIEQIAKNKIKVGEPFFKLVK